VEQLHFAAAPVRLAAYLAASGVDFEFVAPGVPMPTVPAAAAAIGVPESAILKTLLFQTNDGTCVAAVASGVTRLDRGKLAAVVGVPRLKLASPETVLQATGFPAGGVAPVGHRTTFPVVVDAAVLDLTEAWGGGGDEALLLRIAPADIVRLTSAVVADLRADPR